MCVNSLSKEFKKKWYKRLFSSISKKNQLDKKQQFSLSDISFSVEEGSILGIVGSNGAGKSTLFKLLLNSLHKDSGEVIMLGVDNASKEFINVKENIGIIYDSLSIPGYLTANMIDKILSDIYRTWDSEKYKNLLMEFSIPVDKPHRALSRGNKMKLGFAIAFAHDTKILLLDEATSGIDPILRNKILELLIDFKNQGGTVIISSHVLVELEKICDEIIFINNGKMILKDSLYNIQQGKYDETKIEDLFIRLIQEDVA